MSRTYQDYTTEERLMLAERAYSNNTLQLEKTEYVLQELEMLFKISTRELEKYNKKLSNKLQNTFLATLQQVFN